MSKSSTNTLDKRPWLMDWLFEIGHNMAIINHCYEKIQYLEKDIENADDDAEITKIVDQLNNYHELKSLAYEAYDTEMSYIYEAIPEAKRDCRCLLKHTALKLVLAQETADALNNEIGDKNLNLAFKTFAGAVSLALGIEFKTCMRCIYDGVKQASEKGKEHNVTKL